MRPILVGTLLSLAAVAAPRADIIQQVLVKVNGDIITKTEFEQRQIATLRQRNEPFANDDELRKAIVELTPGIILDAVDELLLQQRGRELGFRMTDEAFERVLTQIRTENKLESDEQFQAALRQEGMTMQELRKALERQMLVSSVQQREIMEKISVTDDEARSYYDQHAAEFTTPASLTLREILVLVPESRNAAGELAVNVGLDDEAKARAGQIRARVLAGEEFATLAGQVSDAPSKANGGLIGPIAPDELSPAVSDAIRDLEVGAVSEPLRTARGYQIFKVETRQAPVLESFDQARPKIAERVYAEKRRTEFLKYLDRLRTQAIIVWRNDELKKAYEQALAARRASLGQSS